MANLGGTREVPDSEDELLSSSPADLPNVVPDKLSTAVPVPHQEIQDAQAHGARTHQDTAENTANTAAGSIDGLGAQHEKASSDSVLPQSVHPLSSHLQPLVVETNTPDACLRISDMILARGALPFNASEVRNDDQINQNEASQTRTEHDALYSSWSQQDAETTASPKVSTVDEAHTDALLEQATRDFQLATCDREPDAQHMHISQHAHNEHGESVTMPKIHTQHQETEDLQPVYSGLARAKSEQSEKLNIDLDTFSHSLAASHIVQSIQTSSVPPGSESAQNGSDNVREKANGRLSISTHPTSSTISFPESSDALQQSTTLIDCTPAVRPEAELEKPADAITSPKAVADSIKELGTAANSGLSNPEASSTASTSTLEPSPTTVVQPAQAKTQQEITLAELRAQKAALLTSLASLPAIQVLIEENALSETEDINDDDEATEKDIFVAANRIVQDHIKLLHDYNELKDVGQGLMGLIADQRGVRIVEVQEEFGIDGQD